MELLKARLHEEIYVSFGERDFFLVRNVSNGTAMSEVALLLHIHEEVAAAQYLWASTRLRDAVLYVLYKLGFPLSEKSTRILLVAVFWCVLRGRYPDSCMYLAIANQTGVMKAEADRLLHQVTTFILEFGNKSYLREVTGTPASLFMNAQTFLKTLTQYVETFVQTEETLYRDGKKVMDRGYLCP